MSKREIEGNLLHVNANRFACLQLMEFKKLNLLKQNRNLG